MIAYDRVRDALHEHGSLIRETGTDKAVAQCPCHDDRRPSLSIWPREDGKGVRIKCHAGCDYHNILETLTLHPRDLFNDDDIRQVYRPDAEYRYTKRVKRRHQNPNGSKSFEFIPAGVEDDHSLYGLDRLAPEHTHVLLCEGEKAVEMCWRLGHPAVATGGASRTCDFTPLRGRHVSLIVDRDETGDEWAVRQVKLLEKTAQSIECLQAKPITRHADIVDHFEAGFTLDELVPYTPSPISGAALLDELHAALKKYVAFHGDQDAVAVTLWIAATHALPAFECAPRLVITSPEKRCGKTRLLDIICGTCHEPLATVDATVAAIFRSLGGKHPPTLIIDEADAIFGSKKVAENNEDLRKLINAGHQRGKPALRCVGPLQIPTEFDVFAMAALAGIGTMPDTITDRAVNITMRRRGPGEKVSQFRSRRDKPTLEKLRGRLANWTAQRVDELSKPVPIMPVEDRAADTWEPLIAIADAAGDHWPKTARTACTVLVAAAVEADEDDSLAVKLLADIQAVFGALPGVSFLPSSELAASLNRLDDSPWRDFELTTRKLAYRLKGFGVKPGHNTAKTARGYHRAAFRDAFDRYLSVHPSDPSDPSATGSDQQQSWDGSEPPDGSIRPDKNIRPDETAGQTPFTDGWTDRTDTPAGTGHRPQCPCGRPAPVDRATGLCQWCTIKAAAKQAEGGPVVDSICIIDADRSACLCAEGLPGVVAAVLIAADGRTDLVLVAQELIDDTRHTYNPACPQAPHEQVGPLPLEYLRRLTIAARTHRCGRRTCKGRPCRMRVDRPGSACEFHRDDDRTRR